MDEFERIARFFAPLAARTPEALGLEDDAAWLQPPARHSLVATADALVQGVHFIGTEDPALIARKAVRVNLSDLAAMGAAPYGFLLTTQLPRDVPESWLERFCAGLAEDQDAFDFRLFGGDSTAIVGPVTLSVTALGLLAPGRAPLRRNQARAGDLLMVSGALGASALGLARLQQGATPVWGTDASIDRYLLPQPRIALGEALHGIAHACMDVSDGLLQDAGHIARASGVDIRIDLDRIPLPEAAVPDDEQARMNALTGGDDYELLFTLPSDRLGALQDVACALRLPCTVIGVVAEPARAHMPQVRCPGYDTATRQDRPAGWQHFR